MTDRFVGRQRELEILAADLAAVRDEGRGRFVLIRGRRRVGKSRLVEEFLQRSRAPHVFFSASRHSPPEAELRSFSELFADTGLSAVEFGGQPFSSWAQAIGMVELSARTEGRPTVLVLDELPYLIEGDPSVEGTLATLWDRTLRRAPILLIVVGSDLTMMEALTTHGRPLYGRPTRELPVAPLDPAEVAELIGSEPAAALDAYCVIGGFPQLGVAWGRSRSVHAFVRSALEDPTSTLIVNAERALAAEFPPDAQARAVLSAIGAGERAFSEIGRASGVPRQSLERALDVLTGKKVVVREEPLPNVGGGRPRYLVVDPHMRFWLRFVEPGLPEVERGRPDLAFDRFNGGWESFRGKAVEPIIRDAVSRLAGAGRLQRVGRVGAFWNRTGDLELDITGTSRRGALAAIGSIKWRDRAPFDHRDRRALEEIRARLPVPSDDVPLIGVARAGFRDSGLDVELSAEDMLQAFRA